MTGASRPSISHLSCDPKRPKTLGSILEAQLNPIRQYWN